MLNLFLSVENSINFIQTGDKHAEEEEEKEEEKEGEKDKKRKRGSRRRRSRCLSSECCLNNCKAKLSVKFCETRS